MSALRRWFTQTLPDAYSSWILEGHRRPLTFLLALVVLPLAAIFFLTHLMNVSLWREQSLKNLQVTARLASEIIDETLTESFRFEQLLAAQPEFRQAMRRRDRVQLTPRLQQTLAFTPRVEAALVMTPEGQVVASMPESPALAGRSLMDDEPFLGAQQGGWHPYVSAVYLREGPLIEKVVGVVWPVLDEGEVIGLLQFQHQVEEVKSWLQKIRVEPDGFLYVVDHHSQLVIFPFQILPGKPRVVSDWPPVALPLTDEGASLAFTDRRGGHRWLAGVCPIGTTGWRVVAVQPEGSALRVLHRILWPLGILVGLLALILVAVSMRWAQVQSLSLRLLRQNTKLLKQSQQRRTLDRLGGKEPE
ncbi:MAG: cache domain-containing protein [Candidatus Omnitrophica bacterium]|nr:cache domain-containing protein [Candidatus Omnitrophota bacterium]